MRLVYKIWLGIGTTLLAALAVMAWLGYRHSQDDVEASLLDEGRTLQAVLMAVRRTYQEAFLASGLPIDEHTLALLPAHAMPHIAKAFEAFDDRGIRFNNVSDRPRNPANRADAMEMTAIRYFRANPTAREQLVTFTDPSGARYYQYAAPIWIEPYCLKCHGDPKDAPASIRAAYPEAWGYRAGDLRGIISVRLPAATTEARVLGRWQLEQATHLGVVLLAVLLSGAFVHFLVVRRLRNLNQAVKKLAAGDYACRVEDQGGDEAAALARGFNDMARTLQKDNDDLRLAASVFSHTQDGILFTDAHGVIFDANPAFTRITGYEREEALGRTPVFLSSGRHDQDFFREIWRTVEHQGNWSGEVWNRRKDGDVFPERLTITAVSDDDGRLIHYVGVFNDISQIKQQEAQLVHLAQHDALTGLPNRVLLADRMRQAIGQARRSGLLLAVCYLDLDGFKPVNDEYGHAQGDRLLIEMARRMRSVVRGGDTVARLGGDEFAFLLQGLKNTEECEQSLNRLLGAISRPILIADKPVSLTASIGVSLYPNDDEDPDTLIRHADQAMYSAKQDGRSRYHFYDLEGDRRARSHRESQEGVRQGLAGGEFVLHYQPKVDMLTGQVIGVEALVRWQHPERGLLMPGQFLPAIENSDLDTALGDWVLDEGLRQVDAWRRDGLTMPVSVNISAHHIQRPDFVDRLAGKLAGYPAFQAGDLILEIVETAALADLGRVSAIIAECRRLGCHFALDDFGTGYSSLTYLKRLPVEWLKIDRGFVRDMLHDPEDLAIVEGVIALAEAFGRGVVAEGVDSVEVGLLLMQLGCRNAQGFRIARAMPAAELPTWLVRWQPPETWSEDSYRHWNKENFALLLAEHNHRAWIDNLANHLEGIDGLELPVEVNPNACAFGAWYREHGRQRYGHLAEFAALAEPHERVHALAVELLAQQRNGEGERARARLAELFALREELVAGLRALQARVLGRETGTA
ncbi:EAL domain-containing protein [Parasulfuritortus cantonensis]|uniref:EAL domain-containing protein n=1 Tax=Parasulfuritortus cantonensis TaxID=2528202 RepID=A0A4R1BE40_9PROT|nr:EAL domain-containing protein [Parasulfuritortus cantonensis]TCJ15369.1 EAL domain-containing protein [Parasulfuritortus cantonensis]